MSATARTVKSPIERSIERAGETFRYLGASNGRSLNYQLPGIEKCETCSPRPLEERLMSFRGHLTGTTSGT